MPLTDLELTAARAMLENGFNPCYAGHLDWVSLGGANCGCHRDAACSVPVYYCTVCHDSDYGDNAEADETREMCKQLFNHYLEDEDDDQENSGDLQGMSG